MPNVDKRQMTHWDGCWRHHLDCAVVRVERLEADLVEKQAEMERQKHWTVRAIAVNDELRAEVARQKEVIRRLVDLLEPHEDYLIEVDVSVADVLREMGLT